MEPVLAADAVRKSYADTVALDGVSLAVEAGEVVVLVGPNGAGKTTLVRALTGTTEPDAGETRILGSPPRSVDRSTLGVLPQSFAPPARLTARELLGYYASLYDDASPPEDVLEEVGLADAAHTRYEALSGGQQRRVCLGATLVNEPTVLVLDEPTTGIDPAGRRRVRELIASLAERGAAVLVTTHDMDEAERLADRVALLADGRLRATGTPTELIRAHGGPPRVVVELPVGAGRRARDALVEAGHDAEVRRETVVVRGVEPEAIVGVVETLAAAEIEYEGLEWRRPALEDAYLALAGDDPVDTRAETTADTPEGSQRTTGGDGR